MGIRGVICFPDRQGYRGSEVGLGTEPKIFYKTLCTNFADFDTAKLLIRMGNIEAIYTQNQLNNYIIMFDKVYITNSHKRVYVTCKAFNTKSDLNKFLVKNRQYSGNMITMLHSGAYLLQYNPTQTWNTDFKYITQFNNLFTLQGYADVFGHDGCVYYKSLLDMFKKDIEYIYLYFSNKWYVFDRHTCEKAIKSQSLEGIH